MIWRYAVGREGSVIMRTFILFGSILCAGCFGGGSPDVSSVEVSLGIASSLAHAADLTALAMSGSTVCATVTGPCANYPCDGTVQLAYGDGCPLPLGGAASGTVQ